MKWNTCDSSALFWPVMLGLRLRVSLLYSPTGCMKFVHEVAPSQGSMAITRVRITGTNRCAEMAQDIRLATYGKDEDVCH